MTVNEFVCRVVEKRLLAPGVFELKFETDRPFAFKAGQFISFEVPDPAGKRPLRRAYSLASAPGTTPYELCIQRLENGPGSSYLTALEPGQTVQGFAPFGFFVFRPKPGRDALFISTGTGIAPFRSMALSAEYRAAPPRRARFLLGVRQETDVLYDGDFRELAGDDWIVCLSREARPKPGRFAGRVTDYVRALGDDFPWAETDFYLCGNGAMIREARAILKDRGVAREAVHLEIYFQPGK